MEYPRQCGVMLIQENSKPKMVKNTRKLFWKNWLIFQEVKKTIKSLTRQEIAEIQWSFSLWLLSLDQLRLQVSSFSIIKPYI